MKFDDIDGPIEDLLYEDADFRFFDRQLKMAAQIWRADGLTPASAELELARGRGALMATLSAAYANRQRRFKIDRAHINGTSCGVRASYLPFPPDAPLLLRQLRFAARGQYAFRPVAANEAIATALMAGSDRYEIMSRDSDGEATLALQFEDESEGASIALTVEGDAVAAKLRATALLHAKRGFSGSIGSSATLGFELISAESRPQELELGNVMLGCSGSGFWGWAGAVGGRGASAAMSANPGVSTREGGAAQQSVTPAMTTSQAPMPPLVHAVEAEAEAATQAAVDAAAADAYTFVMRTDNSEEYTGWRLSYVEQSQAWHGLTYGVDMRKRTRRLVDDEASALAAAAAVTNATAAEMAAGARDVSSSISSLRTSEERDSAFLLTAGVRYVVEPSNTAKAEVSESKCVSVKFDSNGVFGMAYKQHVAQMGGGTATVMAQFTPMSVFSGTDSAKLGLSFSSNKSLY